MTRSVAALGLSLSYPSYIVALNVYFKARRTLATAVALSLTGALAILTPQLIRVASWQFGPRAAILVLAGVSLQSLVGAVLLRPLPAPGARGALQRPDKHTPNALSPCMVLGACYRTEKNLSRPDRGHREEGRCRCDRADAAEL